MAPTISKYIYQDVHISAQVVFGEKFVRSFPPQNIDSPWPQAAAQLRSPPQRLERIWLRVPSLSCSAWLR